MFENLIREMIDGYTLPDLTEEEIKELSRIAEDGLVSYIYDVFMY